MAKKKTVAAAKPKAKITKTAGREAALSLPATTVPPRPVASVSPAPKQAAPKVDRVPAPRRAPVAAAGSNGADRDLFDTLDTYVVCGAIAAKGVESLGKEVVSFARASVRAQFELTEALVQATSLQEAFEAQSVFTIESLDSMAAEWAKLSGMSMGLTQEFMAPIHEQVSDRTRNLWLPLAA